MNDDSTNRPLPNDALIGEPDFNSRLFKTVLLFVRTPVLAFSRITHGRSILRALQFGLIFIIPIIVVTELVPTHVRPYFWDIKSDPSIFRMGWLADSIIYKCLALILYAIIASVIVCIQAFVTQMLSWIWIGFSNGAGFRQTFRLFAYLLPLLVLPHFMPSRGYFIIFNYLIQISIVSILAIGLSKVHGISLARGAAVILSSTLFYLIFSFYLKYV